MDKFTSMTKSKRLLLPLLLATSLILPTQIQVQAMPDTNNPAPAQEQPQEQTDQQSPSQGEPQTDQPSQSPSEPQTDQPSPSTSEPQTDKPSPSPSEPQTDQPNTSPSEPQTDKPAPSPDETQTDQPTPSPSEFETKPESSPAGTDASMLTVTPEVADGSSIANAIPFVAPGPQTEAISANGYTYFSVPFTANRPITFTVSPSTTVYLYNATSTSSLASGAGTVTYKSTTAATYYVKVPGVAGDTTTLSSVNGASFAQAYETGYDGIGPKTVTMTIPSTTTSYYKVQLLEGIKYSFSATGASTPGSVALYDEAQVKIGGTTGTAAYSYVPTATGTYYVALKAGGTTGDYNLKLTQYGTTTDTSTAYLMPGPQSGMITDAGYLYFSVPLKAKRTYRFAAENTTGLMLCTTDCNINGYTAEGYSTLSYVPSTDGTYYLKAFGIPGESTTISSVDGSTFAQPYDTSYDGVGSRDVTDSIPGAGTSYYKMQLLEGVAYSISATGPSTPGSVTLYDEAQNKLGSATGITPVSFTPTTSGTYYVALKAGGTGGVYTLKLVQNGTTTTTAFPYLMPGPQTVTILDPGYTYLSVSLKGNRTYYFTTDVDNRAVICQPECGNPSIASNSFSFTPSSDGTYYVELIGTPGETTTLSSIDGTSFIQSYNTDYKGVGPKETRNSIPSTGNSYFNMNLLGGITYQFSAVGPSTPGNITLYDETQKLLGSATGISPISYTPSVNGTYYINIKAGGTGGQYTLKMTQVGATTETAYTFNMPGPQIGLITDAGYTYYSVPLKAYRTYYFNSTNTKLDLCTSGCSNIVAGGNTSFSYKPTADTTYYLRTFGTPGDSTSLTSIDGSTFAQSYESSYTGAGTKSIINGIPALQSAYYKVLLQGGTTYTISATGPVTPGSLTAYDGTQTQVGTPTTGSTAMTLTAPADGLYYIALKAGGSNGDYTLKVVQN